MTRRLDQDRDGPGTQRGEGRPIFPRTVADSPSSQEERTPRLAFSTLPQEGQISQSGPAQADRNHLLYDSGWQSDVYFSGARLLVVGTPDGSVARSKTIDDVLRRAWDIFSEDNPDWENSHHRKDNSDWNPNPWDLNPSGVPITPIPPVLEGGAAVQIEEEELALVG